MCKTCADPHLWFSTQDAQARPGPDWGSAIQLRLQRHVPADAGMSEGPRGPAVLLLHGGSANHRTFTTTNGLGDWLFKAGFDPWLLDWRGSSLVSDCEQNDHTLRHESELYTFNRAAREDVPAALSIMRSDPSVAKGPIALVGHCMGAAVIAEAVACGFTRGPIDRIVLLALGLFYEAAIDSRVKSEERVLERLTRTVAEHPCIDPRVEPDGTLRNSWPDDLDKLYRAWPGGLRAHHQLNTPVTDVENMCNRIAFMYGMPYREDNLAKGIHDTGLPEYFGGFPLQMYLHAARNLREGQATSFDSTGPEIVSDETRTRFRALTSVTLITGESNRLWHRDSIDRMHEWLCRGDSAALRKMTKHVLPNYAHQDLLWGPTSKDDVYPKIGEGLGLYIGAGGAPKPHDPSPQP